MKRFKLSFDEWDCITEKTYRGQEVCTPELTGYVGLLEIRAVRAPEIWRFRDREFVICDRGLRWLTLLPREEFYCLGALLDPDGEIRLWYIDMIAGQGVAEDGVPYAEDLYLDLVVYPDGSVYEDDRDELEAALAQGDITPAQFRLAVETAEKLRRGLLSDPEELRACTRRCLALAEG